LAELLAGFATHFNVGSYIEIVKEKSMMRQARTACSTITRTIDDGAESAAAVLTFAKQQFMAIALPGPSPWRTVDLIDFQEIQKAEPEPKQLVVGLIEKGTKIILGGASKSKKTWTLLDLGLSVAYGAKFLEMETSREKVLYVDFELQPKKMAQRLEAIARAKNIRIERDWFFPLCLRGQLADTGSVIAKIKLKAREIGAGLIIVDPAYKFLAGKDENAAGDIAEFLNGLESVVVETGAAIAIANHFSKGNQSAKTPMDRISGPGVWARDADTLLTMTEHEEEGCLTVSSVLRNFAERPDFVVKWTFPVMRRAHDLDPGKLKQRPGRYAAQYNLDDVAGLLRGRSMTSAEVEGECKARFSMSEATTKRLLQQALKRGMVKKPGLGVWSGLTDDPLCVSPEPPFQRIEAHTIKGEP
jgi:hypothetical protein